MEYNKKMEVFSNLLKTVTLEPLNDKILTGTLVFESQNPFPGYYHDSPDSSPPVYLYLALARTYTLEEILMATQSFQSGTGKTFDAGKGLVTIVNETIPVIRLRHFGDYNIVEELQKAYEKSGIKCLRKTIKTGSFEALVRIIKFLYLKQLDEGIYIDLRVENHGYVTLPGFLKWKEFLKLTQKVKYNWEGSKFDAAMGSFFHEGTLHSIARIYSSKISALYLDEVRKLYLGKFK